MVGEIIWKKINTDGVDILRPDLGETGGVPWSLRPQAGNLDFNSNVYVCVCVCVCVFLGKEKPGKIKIQGLITFFFFNLESTSQGACPRGMLRESLSSLF